MVLTLAFLVFRVEVRKRNYYLGAVNDTTCPW
jgi:hypothetical protein